MSELIDREAVREFIKSYRHSTDVAFDMEKHLDEIPTASPWHRVSDGLPKDGQCCLFFTVESGIPERDAWFGIYRNDWEGDINMRFDYWMPIEPPEEEEHGN